MLLITGRCLPWKWFV